MRQDTDFKKDMEEYGTVGENWFREKLKASKKTMAIIETTGDKRFEKYDIDFIQITNPSATAETVLEFCEKGQFMPPKVNLATTYEVKTDTQILKTGNIAYEVMSWTNPGCMARTLANYIVYIGINENKEIKEAYLLDTKELRYFILHHFADYKKVKPVFMKHDRDEAALFLIKIDLLLNEGIAKKINI